MVRPPSGGMSAGDFDNLQKAANVLWPDAILKQLRHYSRARTPGSERGLNTCGGSSRDPPNVTYVRNDPSVAPESWFEISCRFPRSSPKITLQCRILCRLHPARALDNRTSTRCSIPAER